MPTEPEPTNAMDAKRGVMLGHTVPVWQRAIVILSGTLVSFILVLCLQWARPVLIPIALAILLTFLLNPLVKMLTRRGLNQVLAVAISVTVSGILLMCLAWMVTKQVSGMVAELPENTQRIKAKLKTLKELGSGPTNERIGQMIEEISEEINPPGNRSSPSSTDPEESVGVDPKTGTIIVQSEPVHWSGLTGYLGSAFEALGTLALALVLLVFFLIEREDLRDRVVLLAGRARLALTSKAMEDMTDRISRYIGMVALINGGFGLVLTIGLYFLGVRYPLLWGFIAAVFRFIPYIGPWIGAIFPITMSLAMSDGWWQPLGVLAFVTVVELVTNNAIEPLLFGHTTGVSPTALLVSAACWLYLWGPVGLILSAPFAVCLVVLGKNVPQLSFLYLLLGDRPALNADYSFYQRLMLGDSLEAAGLAVKKAKASSTDEIYDALLIPALNYMKRDLQRDYLDEDDEQTVLEGMRVTLEKLSALHNASNAELPAADPEANESSALQNVPEELPVVLACPADDESDLVALQMLSELIDPTRCHFEISSLEALSSEIVSRIHSNPPALLLIASVPPGGLPHCRYLCKRLRRAAPNITIIVGRFRQRKATRLEREQLESSGASIVAATLLEARNLLKSRLPLAVNNQLGNSVSEAVEAADGLPPGNGRAVLRSGALSVKS